MIKSIKNISSSTNKQWRSILLIYFIQLIFAVFLAIFTYRKLEIGLGNSLELDRLTQGFDRTVFSDFINQFPEIVEAIQNRFSWLILVFLIVSIFLHAGLLGNIKKQKYEISDFLKSGIKYFLKFMGVAIVAITKTIAILALIWIPFTKWVGDPLQTFHSDKTFILTAIAFVILSVLLVIIIWIWSVLTRYEIIEEIGFIESAKSAWKDIRKSFIKYFTVGILIFLLHILLTWLYTLVVDDWGAAKWFCILGLVFIQQLFSLCRIWIRVFAYSWIKE